MSQAGLLLSAILKAMEGVLTVDLPIMASRRGAALGLWGCVARDGAGLSAECLLL